MTEPVILPPVGPLVFPLSPRILPLTWDRPAILPAGLPALVDRFWAEQGAAGVDVTVHVVPNGKTNVSTPPPPPRRLPYADLYFVPTHHMTGFRGLGAVGDSCWLFAQWRALLDGLLEELQLTAGAAQARMRTAAPGELRRRLDARRDTRTAFSLRVLADDERLGQPRTEIGGVLGALWGRRLKRWAAFRKTFRSQPYEPREYPRAVLDDLRAYECGGQYALSHLVSTLLERRYPGTIAFGMTDLDVRTAYRFLRNQRYLLRYHLLNACPELGIWRTVLARTPGKDGARRVYHFFTAGERERLLAFVGPRLPAPKPAPWPPPERHPGWGDADFEGTAF